MLAAILAATLVAGIACQALAGVAGGRIKVGRLARTPPRVGRRLRQALGRDAVWAIVAGHDPGFAAGTIHRAMLLAKQLAAREAAFDRLALANVAEHARLPNSEV